MVMTMVLQWRKTVKFSNEQTTSLFLTNAKIRT